MKPRKSTYRSLLIVAFGTLVMLTASLAAAQQSGLPYPPIPPGMFSVYGGPLYLSGGIKFTNLDSVKLNIEPTEVSGQFEHRFTDKVWYPVIEVGYQGSNFYECFASFAWYSTSHAYSADQSGPNSVLRHDYHLDMEVYETRTGGRSWTPIWGLGRVGVHLGVINSIVPFHVDVIRRNQQGVVEGHQDDWFWHFAGFCGLETEAAFRNFFAKATAEYSLGTTYTYNMLLNTETEMNISGFSAIFQAGFRF